MRYPTEMELRVAEAMYIDAHAETAAMTGMTIPPFAEYVGRDLWIKSARAAIRAMRLETQDNAIMDAFQCASFKEWNRAIDTASPPIPEV